MVKDPSTNAGDIRDTGSIPGSGRSRGGGHGKPLQYSCLENPMDRGAWQAPLHRVTQSRTQLKQLSLHTHISLRSSRSVSRPVVSSSVTLWTVACSAPLSMEFTRQAYWNGLLFPTPGELPHTRIEPRSPALQASSLPFKPPGKPISLSSDFYSQTSWYPQFRRRFKMKPLHIVGLCLPVRSPTLYHLFYDRSASVFCRHGLPWPSL